MVGLDPPAEQHGPQTVHKQSGAHGPPKESTGNRHQTEVERRLATRGAHLLRRKAPSKGMQSSRAGAPREDHEADPVVTQARQSETKRWSSGAHPKLPKRGPPQPCSEGTHTPGRSASSCQIAAAKGDGAMGRHQAGVDRPRLGRRQVSRRVLTPSALQRFSSSHPRRSKFRQAGAAPLGERQSRCRRQRGARFEKWIFRSQSHTSDTSPAKLQDQTSLKSNREEDVVVAGVRSSFPLHSS